MSRATKLKHVAREVEDFTIPTEIQSIVQIMESRGNNLHEVADSTGEQYLVSMPTKFRRNIWVKHGDFVLVEPIAEGDKVKAEIVKILTKEHQKWYRAQKCWPEGFDKKTEATEEKEDDLFVNTNRMLHNRDATDNESDSSSDESDLS